MVRKKRKCKKCWRAARDALNVIVKEGNVPLSMDRTSWLSDLAWKMHARHRRGYEEGLRAARVERMDRKESAREPQASQSPQGASGMLLERETGPPPGPILMQPGPTQGFPGGNVL